MCLVADRVRNKCDASKQAEEGSLRLAAPVAHSTGTRLLACILQISGYSGKPSWQVSCPMDFSDRRCWAAAPAHSARESAHETYQWLQMVAVPLPVARGHSRGPPTEAFSALLRRQAWREKFLQQSSWCQRSRRIQSTVEATMVL